MPTQTFRTSKSFSTAFTHIARLRFKGNDDKQAEDMYRHPTTSGNSPPPLEGVFLGVSHFWGYLKRTEIENPWNSRGFLVNFGSGPGEPIRSITYDILLLTYCAFPA
jgi:hypothetical protein